MSWLLIAIVGYLFNAVSFVVDKALLGHAIKNQFVYTFFIGMLSGLALILIPLGARIPPAGLGFFIVLSGALIVAALIFLFAALKHLEASRLIPFIGGLIPIATFVFSYTFINERLTSGEFLAFALLLIGGTVITVDPHAKRTNLRQRRGWMEGACAAVVFALSFVITKYAYIRLESLSFSGTESVITVLVWGRIGSVLAALGLLLNRSIARAIRTTWTALRWRMKSLFVGSQMIGATGFVLQSVAISRASVTLVNALQGVQYLFLLVMVLIAWAVHPQLLKEKVTPSLIAVKFVAILFISSGLWVLSRASA